MGTLCFLLFLVDHHVIGKGIEELLPCLVLAGFENGVFLQQVLRYILLQFKEQVYQVGLGFLATGAAGYPYNKTKGDGR